MRTAKSCGPGAPMQAPSFVDVMIRKSTVANAGSPRRAPISRKPSRGEGRLSPPVPVVNAPRANSFLRGDPGCSGHPAFPAPFVFGGPKGRCKARAKRAARTRAHASPSSSPAKAGDPVRRGPSAQALPSLEYWIVRPSRTMTAEIIRRDGPHSSVRNSHNSGKNARSSALLRKPTPEEPPLPRLNPMIRSTVFMWRKRHCWKRSSMSTSFSASS